jgi:hypothetical protein
VSFLLKRAERKVVASTRQRRRLHLPASNTPSTTAASASSRRRPSVARALSARREALPKQTRPKHPAQNVLVREDLIPALRSQDRADLRPACVHPADMLHAQALQPEEGRAPASERRRELRPARGWARSDGLRWEGRALASERRRELRPAMGGASSGRRVRSELRLLRWCRAFCAF